MYGRILFKFYKRQRKLQQMKVLQSSQRKTSSISRSPAAALMTMEEDKDYHYVHNNGRNGEKSVTVFMKTASRRKNGVVESQITKEGNRDNNNFVAVAYKSIKRKTSGIQEMTIILCSCHIILQFCLAAQGIL